MAIVYSEADDNLLNSVAAEKIQLLTQGVASWQAEFADVSNEVGPLTGDMKADYAILDAEMQKKEHYGKWHKELYDSQDHLWEAGQKIVDDHITSLTNQYDKLMKPGAVTRGTLSLNAELVLPEYAVKIDIHRMPGGYGENSFNAGALYTVVADAFYRGYRSGQTGQFAVEILKRKFPDFVPRKLLDVGCAAGNSTWAWCEAFPNAEVHGVDFGQGLLKFGHMEAEARGLAVHFHQMNAEDMRKFEDESFDLVVSHIVFHETSPEAIVAIIKECMRILRPGGVMFHMDVCNHDWHYQDRSKIFLQHYQTHYNAEPFWSEYASLKVGDLTAQAGLPLDFEEQVPKIVGSGHWYVFGSRKPE